MMLKALMPRPLATVAAGAMLIVAAMGCKEASDSEEATSADDSAEQAPEGKDQDEETEAAADEGEGDDEAPARPGEPAPSFTLQGSDGEAYSLEDYRGEWVILEWINHDCPFVKKFYGAGKMQELQATYTDPDGADVTWFSIASSAPGQQGNETPQRWNELTEEKEAQPTAVLIDEEGTVGKKYVARTTPHMYVIDPAGTLIYQGALDDKPSADPESLEAAENYLELVMSAALKGEEPPFDYRDPYGCAVKYGPAT